MCLIVCSLAIKTIKIATTRTPAEAIPDISAEERGTVPLLAALISEFESLREVSNGVELALEVANNKGVTPGVIDEVAVVDIVANEVALKNGDVVVDEDELTVDDELTLDDGVELELELVVGDADALLDGVGRDVGTGRHVGGFILFPTVDRFTARKIAVLLPVQTLL